MDTAESTTSPSTSSHSGFSVPIHWHPSPNIYSVIPSRSYKQDDNWKETDSLGFDDLLTMGKLFDLAHTWIMHQQQADAKGRKESTQAAA